MIDKTLMEQWSVPGISVAVVEYDEIVHQQIVGTTKHGDPLDPATPFQAASLSKPLFAYIVMQLVQHGHFDLDTPLIPPLAQPTHHRPPCLDPHHRAAQLVR